MKRRDLVIYLVQNDCQLLREEVRHSWWENPVRNRRSGLPRHQEISETLARKICSDLGLEQSN